MTKINMLKNIYLLEGKGRDTNDCNSLRDYVRTMCPETLVSKYIWL